MKNLTFLLLISILFLGSCNRSTPECTRIVFNEYNDITLIINQPAPAENDAPDPVEHRQSRSVTPVTSVSHEQLASDETPYWEEPLYEDEDSTMIELSEAVDQMTPAEQQQILLYARRVIGDTLDAIPK